MSRIRILDEAARELDAAVEYLEQERQGYGRVLLDEYAEKLQQIQRFPKGAPRVSDAPKANDLRAFSPRRFRYSLIVGDMDGLPTIIAFAHHSRAPGYWHARLKSRAR